MIQPFNGKEQLKELVKVTKHLPAFFCVCVQALVHPFVPVFIWSTHGPVCDHYFAVSQWCRDESWGKAKRDQFHNHVYFHSLIVNEIHPSHTASFVFFFGTEFVFRSPRRSLGRRIIAAEISDPQIMEIYCSADGKYSNTHVQDMHIHTVFQRVFSLNIPKHFQYESSSFCMSCSFTFSQMLKTLFLFHPLEIPWCLWLEAVCDHFWSQMHYKMKHLSHCPLKGLIVQSRVAVMPEK